MNVEAILAEMEDWGRALLAEHENRTCNIHGPVVPSKNMGESIVAYADRIRSAVEARDIDDSFHGETPYDLDRIEVRRFSPIESGAVS